MSGVLRVDDSISISFRFYKTKRLRQGTSPIDPKEFNILRVRTLNENARYGLKHDKIII